MRSGGRVQAGMVVVRSVDSTAGSITHTAAPGLSAISANPRVIKPQKYDPANVTRNDVKVIPKSNPTYLARSPLSIFIATFSIMVSSRLRPCRNPSLASVVLRCTSSPLHLNHPFLGRHIDQWFSDHSFSD